MCRFGGRLSQAEDTSGTNVLGLELGWHIVGTQEEEPG